MERKRHVGICSLALTPMAAVGVSARLTKRSSGCQNQKWLKTPQPTIAGMTLWPDLESSEMVMLRPPASSTLPAPSMVTAALDRELNEMSYILPGLGDAGDRIYGTVRS